MDRQVLPLGTAPRVPDLRHPHRPFFSTTDVAGPILVTVLGMVAELERSFIRERQKAGIERAKANGVYKGRKPTVPVEQVRAMHKDGVGPSADDRPPLGGPG